VGKKKLGSWGVTLNRKRRGPCRACLPKINAGARLRGVRALKVLWKRKKTTKVLSRWGGLRLGKEKDFQEKKRRHHPGKVGWGARSDVPLERVGERSPWMSGWSWGEEFGI